ncbi:MAG TPA: glycosyltransferase family 2 protein [Actinopolymorphaceae bacterium]|jgi:glycosyltransferase involved in cell wall biosynthesis
MAVPPAGRSVEASVIIPAHNEARSIGRLLDQLTAGVESRFEILVMCNGCTDHTAGVARQYPVTVVELPEPSKRAAMDRGDQLASCYPRVFLDADVEISGDHLRRLVAAVSSGPILASGPTRVLPRSGVSFPVRWYYDVWEALPQTKSGLFGRGVIALSEAGNMRVRTLTLSMSDDLVIGEAFAPDERTIVTDAVVTVHPPKTLADLLKRRVRVHTGNAEAASTRSDESRTSWRRLSALVRSDVSLAPKLPIFVGVAALARLRAQRAIRSGDFTTWQRDESSRR